MTSDPTSATSDVVYAIVVATRETTGGREFLMVEHRTRGWELPGGKLEGKEGPVHCALREFREETGHLLKEPRYVTKLHKDNGLCYIFTGNLGERVAVVEDEAILAQEWFTHLPPRDRLAFPDDPYDVIGEALGLEFTAAV